MTHYRYVLEKKSKYQEKVKNRWYETESGKIAYQIEQFGLAYNYFKNKDLRQSDVVLLEDGYSLSISKEKLALYIFKQVPDKANRSYLKVVPMLGLKKEVIFDILQAQPWVYL